jgi:outer membrane protein OmpA-like peptidoglycan-associated protein
MEEHKVPYAVTLTLVLLVFSFLFSTLSWTAVLPNQDPKTLLFEEADKAKAQAEAAQTQVYSPTQFQTAMKYYREAEEDYKKGKNLEDIRKKAKMAAVYFLKSVETTKLAHTHLKDCINARNDALAAESPQFRQHEWEEAETAFRNAVKTLEDGNLNGATSRARRAERQYRTVELEAIKANYLDQTRALIEEAREKDVRRRAPLTLARAQELVQKAEEQLSENRYDTDEARQLAQEAKYEAQHAMYLAEQIKAMEENDETIETVLLNAEDPIKNVGNEFDLNLRFHEGVAPTIQSITEQIRTLQHEKASLEQDLRDMGEQVTALSGQVKAMESQLGDLKSKEATLTEIMIKQKEAREKFQRLENTFTSEEAQIARVGDQVVIRLYGLTFPVGKSTIEPKYFGLLSKVLKAMEEYPDNVITVEGHTDSYGGDAANQRLSTERAHAVQEYLMATAGLDTTRVKAIGFGETKPIASNETKEGRRKNRRIDVVIHP